MPNLIPPDDFPSAVAWSGIGSLILYKLVDWTIGLRVTTEAEREGLDIAEHGERAYNY